MKMARMRQRESMLQNWKNLKRHALFTTPYSLECVLYAEVLDG
jgi:hypothetical protein